MDVQEFKVTRDAVDADSPTGAWGSAPATAATGVDMVNNSGYPVFVNISGGTVTSIKQDGVVVGVTAGTFRVRNGGAIQWVGSVAPTVKWYF